MTRSQKGFTIIELIMVMLILGILAAFAIPRYVNLASNARIASVQGLAGSIRSAAYLANVQWTAESASDANLNSIVVNGVTINILNRFPTTTDIPELLQSTDGFTFSLPGSIATFKKIGAPNNGDNCKVEYGGASSNPNDPVLIVPTTDDC